MAHAAKINASGVVEEVVVVPDGLGGDESDEAIAAYCRQLGLEGTWIRTSYNAAVSGFRGSYAGVGFRYDSSADTFVPPAG